MRKFTQYALALALSLGMAVPVLAHGPSSVRVEPTYQRADHPRHQHRDYKRSHKRDHKRDHKRYRSGRYYDSKSDYRYRGDHGYHRGHNKYWKHQPQHYDRYPKHKRRHSGEWVKVLPRGSYALVIGGDLYHRWRDNYYISGFHQGEKVFFSVDFRL